MVYIYSWVYTYYQIYQIVYIKYAQPFVCQSYLSKVFFNSNILL